MYKILNGYKKLKQLPNLSQINSLKLSFKNSLMSINILPKDYIIRMCHYFRLVPKSLGEDSLFLCSRQQTVQ